MEFIDANLILILYEPYITEYGKEQFESGFYYGVYITLWLTLFLWMFRILRFF